MSFKPGDKVMIRDGSWSIKSVAGQRKGVGWVDLADHDLIYTVVSDSLDNVLESRYNGHDDYAEGKFRRNTTIIQNGPVVILIHRDFLKPAECPTCKRVYL